MTEEHVSIVSRSHSPDGDQYQQVRQRETLYRVLATNIVGQLHETGHGQQELVGFASAVLRAINDGQEEWQTSNERSRADDGGRKPVCRINADGPRIVGQLVQLLRPCAADRSHLERWSREPLVEHSLFPAVLEDMLANLASGETSDDRLDFLICQRKSGRPVGAVSLFHIDRGVGQAELAKMVGEPDQRGRGFAREATRLLLTFAFEHLGLNRVTLRTLGGNLKNIKLNERMGFQFEGVLRQAALMGDTYADVVQMSMLRDDFESHFPADTGD